MSSPRRTASRTPERVVNGHGPRTPNRTTPRNVNRTPSRRTPGQRRIAGTSERDVISGSEGNAGSRRSQIGSPSSPYHGGISEVDLSSPMNYGTPSSVGSTRSGISGTPIRLRPDVRQQSSARQLAVIPENDNENAGSHLTRSSETDSGPSYVIWGTNVVVSKCKQKFKRFVQEFTSSTPAEDEVMKDMNNTSPMYLQKLIEIEAIRRPVLDLNCAHLEEFDSRFCKQLVCYPQEVIPTLDMAANEIFFEMFPAAVIGHQIQVRPYNLCKIRNMRGLNPEDVDQLITVQGMVIRTSNLIPEIREAFFRCIVCSFETTVTIERGYINEPTLCTSCSTNHCFQMIHNRSAFSDKQIVKLQESPDDIPAGQTPHTITLLCYNDLVDSVQPGERVTVTGIYRAIPVQLNPRMSNVHAVYKTFIDVVHFRKLDTNRLHLVEEGKQHKFSPERIDMMKDFATRTDVYDRLANAIAPSIFENVDIKKGILLQLFGGTRKISQTSGRGKMRSEINILLCGDPGTSKSQLLSYVYDLVPRSQYTSGKGSSAVGLTAYVTKDPETRQLVLQTGALVLADNGICCIDEFDKMNDSTRSVLHEVMEQQTLSIAKAGIICQLNARTSILAAANPCESKWNARKTIVENILLPHSLLSRFDLIFLMLDPQDEIYDRNLATHLVALYHQRPEELVEDEMEMEILRDYITYAREYYAPKISEEAERELVKNYVEMRQLGSGRGQISAYPRQLESLIRISEAHARMRLSETVELRDVAEAWRLYREALKQSATDPRSGCVDISILVTGRSHAQREESKIVAEVLRNIVKKKTKGTKINYKDMHNELREIVAKHVEYSVFDDSLKEVEEEDHSIKVIPRISIEIL